MNKKGNYYKSFNYIIEKKLTVEDNTILKDYAKQQCYFYIIFDVIDKNRFLYISSKHIEEKTIIYPETFNLYDISSKKDSILLKKYKTSFSEVYFNIVNEGKHDISIITTNLVDSKKGDKIFRKYKTHTKKIAIDNPNYFIEVIKSCNTTSCKKKFKKEVLCENYYNEEIYNHFISTLFIIDDRKFQRFNDHFLILDEGKTGKSSLVAYLSSKADNVSIAGLYGSSDSKGGKFKGGLITLTKKTIIIDEVNELASAKHHSEKILGVLNTILENGEYNYIKQYSAKIESSNQFGFMGNISDVFNFPIFIEGTVGNSLTIGRRIGMITYSTNLGGFKKGFNRPVETSEFLRSVQKYLSKIFNYILNDTCFYKKILKHKGYAMLENYYKQELSKIKITDNNQLTKDFLVSHSEAIDRIITRSLKLYIFDNLDRYISKGIMYYDNKIPFEILKLTKIQMDKNILNFQNINEHVENCKITSRKSEYNTLDFNNLPKLHQNTINIFLDNLQLIKNKNSKGVSYYQLQNNQEIKQHIYQFKTKKKSHKPLNDTLSKYGCRIIISNNDVYFSLVSEQLFLSKMTGVQQQSNIIPINKDISKVWNKKEDHEDDFISDLN